MSNTLRRLQELLDYHFQDDNRLRRALKHRSAGRDNNERLEFLGDAVIGLVIAHQLFLANKDHEEGDLSRLRASLVNESALAGIARTLELGDRLEVGPGELKSGGYRRGSVLADALEAIIGAVYLDGGFAAADTMVRRLFHHQLADLPDPETLKDPKTRLQEYLQSRNAGLPEYAVIDTAGPDHKRQFTVRCNLPDGRHFESSGTSRRKAEQGAAEIALEAISNG